MNRDSGAPETPAAFQKSPPKFILFLLFLVCAVALGFGVRYYRGRPLATTGGAWEVYFSDIHAVESRYSLEKRLVARLATAEVGIDAALYHLDSAPIADAFIEARSRGVQVRVVAETDNIDEAAIGRLQAAGIPVVDDDGQSGLMHHKFIVIDERYVWTGSYNTTHNGAYRNNNNVLFIDSVRLAYNFTQEFRELFLAAQRGTPVQTFIPYPKVTLSDGTQIFTYFSPEDETLSPLLRELAVAKRSIHFMAFSFTHDALGSAMRERFEAGIDVQGVFEQRQVDNKYSVYSSMKAAGLPVIQDKNRGAMHHKVIVVDAETVITGSYNFSKNAETRNSENLLIIKGNRELARAYLAEFERVAR